jgi:hypothetical protein
MWVYDITAGTMSRNGAVIATGYAGHEWGKNNPNAISAPGIGPIPPGTWCMTEMRDSPNTGPRTIVLEPCEGTDVKGRSAFRIHGDSAKHPGDASRGCIILNRSAREMIWASNDRALTVVE